MHTHSHSPKKSFLAALLKQPVLGSLLLALEGNILTSSYADTPALPLAPDVLLGGLQRILHSPKEGRRRRGVGLIA